MARSTATPGQVLRRNLPGRMSVTLNYYEKTKRVHRPVPSHTLTFDVVSPAEARRLFAALKHVIDWRLWSDQEVNAGAPAAPAADDGKKPRPSSGL